MSISKILSLIISIIYLIIAYTLEGGFVFSCLLYLLLPLLCIWFSEEMGNRTEGWGVIGMSLTKITDVSPGFLVEFMGWIILLLPVLIWFIIINY